MMEQQVLINIPVEQRIKRQRPENNDSASAEISDIRKMFMEMNHMHLHTESRSLHSSSYYSMKRALDVCLSLTFIILVMSWVFPIVALLIKLTSKGPIFFLQKRTGYKGIDFDCMKFRTMYVNDDADTVQATNGDKRITPVGKFLRLTHLDETPQFFNVLIGDMSVVGPRPHMLYHTEYYAKRIPYYNLRHDVQPGMTGMAQIKGYIGEINVERELRKRIQWDIYYMKNRSIWLDIKILFTTAGGVLVKTFNIFSRK